MQLSEYITNVQDVLHDPNANFYSLAQLARWINRARHKVAQNGRCVRYLPPTRGSVSSITVNAAGAGYTTATAEISEPDAQGIGTFVQATATVTLSGGAVTGFMITEPGSGYVGPATVTISGDGSGATGTVNLTPHVTTIAQQEVYDLQDFVAVQDALTPGIGDIIGVQSIAVSWGALKPVLQRCDWSSFQAYLRSNNFGYTNYPQVWAQYGQGVTGSIYVFPIPAQASAMDVDCYFDVLDLTSTQTVDLIPVPWQEPVFYYAAQLAYENAQRLDDARMMLNKYDQLMNEARAAQSTDMVPSFYVGSGAYA